MKKPTHGGSRPGAGAKKKFDGETTRIYITVPIDKVEEIKPKLLRIVKKYMKSI